MGAIAQYCCAEREAADKLPKMLPDKPLKREKQKTISEVSNIECIEYDDGDKSLQTPRVHMDNYSKFKRSLPFHRMHVRHFFK